MTVESLLTILLSDSVTEIICSPLLTMTPSLNRSPSHGEADAKAGMGTSTENVPL